MSETGNVTDPYGYECSLGAEMYQCKKSILFFSLKIIFKMMKYIFSFVDVTSLHYGTNVTCYMTSQNIELIEKSMYIMYNTIMINSIANYILFHGQNRKIYSLCKNKYKEKCP